MARDIYGSMGSADYRPDAEGTMRRPQNIQASADAFGAQVGEAMQRNAARTERFGSELIGVATDKAKAQAREEAILRKKAQEEAEKREQQAIETKVNDEWANGYIPQAVAARTRFDMAEGRDKVSAHEKYLSELKELNNSFTENYVNDYELGVKTSLSQRRFIQESESAGADLARAQVELARDAASERIMSDAAYAAQNYNNQTLVDDTLSSIDGQLELQAIDNDVDISTPEGQAALDQMKNEVRGELATSMVSRALASNDVGEASRIRAQYGPFIPGHQQIALDRSIAQENIRQTSEQGVRAILNGKPLPEASGWPPVEVQATVADTAEEHGVNPNHALTVAMIETSMGQNLGKRGDIGQTGKGGDLKEQSFNMVTELKKAEGYARQALGRAPEPWEIYLCYQQGAGGGPALLKAAMSSPDKRAVEVLAPLYKRDKLGFDAIVHNGGNASMNSGDFLALIRKKYEHNAMLAMCNVQGGQKAPEPSPEGAATITEPTGKTIGQAIRDTQKQTGPALQAGADPIATLNNFKEKSAVWEARINAIPWETQRAAKSRQLRSQEGILSAAAEKYQREIKTQADNYLYDPEFMDIKQVPSPLMAQMKSHPDVFGSTIQSLKLAANKNRGDKADPTVTADLYAKMSELFTGKGKDTRVAEGKLTDATRIQDEIMEASDAGFISYADAKTMLKTVQVNLASSASRAENNWFPSYGGEGHYEKAYKQFAESGASPGEINRMFRDYIVAADKLNFDRQVDKGGLFDWQAWTGETEDEKSLSKQVNSTIQAIKKNQAANKYSGLLMLDRQPNAVIGRDGTHMVVSSDAPQGSADTKVAIKTQRARNKRTGAEVMLYFDAKGNIIDEKPIGNAGSE